MKLEDYVKSSQARRREMERSSGWRKIEREQIEDSLRRLDRAMTGEPYLVHPAGGGKPREVQAQFEDIERSIMMRTREQLLARLHLVR